MLREVIGSDELKEQYRTKQVYFTRNRKQPFVELLVFMMNILQKSLQMEILNFHKVLSDLRGLPSPNLTFSGSLTGSLFSGTGIIPQDLQ